MLIWGINIVKYELAMLNYSYILKVISITILKGYNIAVPLWLTSNLNFLLANDLFSDIPISLSSTGPLTLGSHLCNCYFGLTRPGFYLNKWAESQNLTFNGHLDINAACVEWPVKSERKIKKPQHFGKFAPKSSLKSLFPTCNTSTALGFMIPTTFTD